tara:strand:- start:603 stop:899 length:297 start_codon:yes stop_codon:yes gene_type:complete
MGLRLETTLDSGEVGEYFSIEELTVRQSDIVVRLYMYKSEALKTSGCSKMDSQLIVIEHDKSETAEGNLYAIAYTKLKESRMLDGVEENKFANAVDVL